MIDEIINTENTLIIIPAFNEGEMVSSTINNLSSYFQNILVIDDGSIDNTLEESIKSLSTIVLHHPCNCGQGRALLTGIKFFLEKTKFEYLITFDADGQHYPQDAKKMLDFAIFNKFDAVLGSRFLDKSSGSKIPLFRKIILKTANYFERIFFGLTLTDSHNGLRVLNRKASKLLKKMKSAEMAHATEFAKLLKNKTINLAEFPVRVDYSSKVKKSQSPFSSLNIISDLMQGK